MLFWTSNICTCIEEYYSPVFRATYGLLCIIILFVERKFQFKLWISCDFSFYAIESVMHFTKRIMSNILIKYSYLARRRSSTCTYSVPANSIMFIYSMHMYSVMLCLWRQLYVGCFKSPWNKWLKPSALARVGVCSAATWVTPAVYWYSVLKS